MRVTFRTAPTKLHLLILTSPSPGVSWRQAIQQRPSDPPRRWQVHRCKEPRSLNDCVEQSLPPPPRPLPCGISSSMWPGCLRVISPLHMVAGFSKASAPRDQEGSCKGSWNLVLEITESSPLHSTGYEQVTEPAPIQRGDYRRA